MSKPRDFHESGLTDSGPQVDTYYKNNTDTNWDNLRAIFHAKVTGVMNSIDGFITSGYGKTIPAIVLATSTGIGMQVYDFERNEGMYIINNTLKSELSEINLPIESRILAYQQLLQGVRGLIETTKGNLTSGNFREYIRIQNLEKNFPEVHAVSISYHITQKSLPYYIKKMKNEGFPEFGRSLQYGSTEYAPVTYIEPFSAKNSPIIGLDNLRDTVRSKAIKEAQLSNSWVLSEFVCLKQGDNGITSSGYLVYVPFYKKGLPSTTLEEREANIEGWIALSFDANKLISNILKDRFSHLAITIFDNGMTSPPIFDTRKTGEAGNITENTIKKEVSIGNRTWTFVVSATQELERIFHIQEHLNNIILFWAIISGLITPFIHFLITKRIDSKSAIDRLGELTLELRESEQRYSALFRKSKISMLLIDPKSGKILDANNCATGYYGYPLNEMKGMDISNINMLSQEESITLLSDIKAGKQNILVLKHKLSSGLIRNVRVFISQIMVNHKLTLFAIVEDVTDSTKALEEVVHMANYDALTGLPKRNLLEDRLEKAFAQSDRNNSHIVLMFLDLDNFKTVNDTLGHDMGDKLLIEAAKRMQECIREVDTVARLGGDEFLILLPDMEDPQSSSVVAEKLLTALCRPFYINDQEIRVGASIGGTSYPKDAKSVEDLMKNGDIAMYRAKSLGRGNFQFYSPDMNSNSVLKQELATALHHALENNEISTHFQPIIDAKTGDIVAMEAFIRWKKPGKGIIEPSKFIPIAEDNGLIILLGNWVIRDVCKKIQEWNAAGINVPEVSINLSPRQFKTKTFGTDILKILNDSGVKPSQINIEVTESMLFENIGEAVLKIKELTDFGFTFSIDDFGTGYSILSSFRNLQVKKVKIDKSIISNLEIDGNDSIIRGMIHLAHSVGLQVVAEGVETDYQYNILAGIGCDYIQGYLFGRPADGDFTKELLRKTQKSK